MPKNNGLELDGNLALWLRVVGFELELAGRFRLRKAAGEASSHPLLDDQTNVIEAEQVEDIDLADIESLDLD